LGLSQHQGSPPDTRTHKWCVAPTQLSVLQLVDGSAEIFGCELALRQPVDVKGHTLAVFTWEGCRLRVEGTPELM